MISRSSFFGLFALLFATTASAGCSSCHKPTTGDDAGMIVISIDAGAPVASVASAAPSASAAPEPTAKGSATAAPASGGPFAGNYQCGSLWGPIHITQSGDKVTATHTEAGGTTLETAVCTVSGNKCVGTYTAKDSKTGKPKGQGNVTIGKNPTDGKIGYTQNNNPAASCKPI